MREGAEHVFQVAEDIGVVELAVIDRKHVRQVLDELATLVEEGRVVFIALNDERAALLPWVRRIWQVARDAADEPTWLGAVGLEQDRGHAGRGGLTMSAGDDDIAAFV